MDRIANAARVALPAGFTPTQDAVAICITYYYDGEIPDIDIDNIIKPIQDALNGVVYVDDKQVFYTRSRRISRDSYNIDTVPEALIARLSRGHDFLWIEISFP